MINIFYSFVANSLNITFLIIIMLLLEPFFKKYFSAVCLYRLWVVLLIGLLIPIHFESTQALFYISSPRISVEDKVSNDLDVKGDNAFYKATSNKDSLQKLISQDKGETYNKEQGMLGYFFKQLLPTKIIDILQYRYVFLCLLWILGASVLLIVKGIQYYKYRKVLKRFMIPINQEDFKAQYSQCVQELNSNNRKEQSQFGKVIVYKCSIITSPMTIGIIKPTILLPNVSYSNKDLYFILKHEYIHIRRRDSMVKLIRLIVLALNWYNPFCYVLSRHLDDWCETSCDELVIHNSTTVDRLNYSKLLLKYTAVDNKTISIINMIGGKDNMKNRLYSIINHRKKWSSKMLIALLVCIVFTTAIVSVGNHTEASASSDTETTKEESLGQLEEVDKNKADNAKMNPANSNTSDSEMTINNIKAVDSTTKEDSTEQETSTANEVSTADKLRQSVVEYAKQAEGTPYLYGGNDLSLGVDCGGLVHVIYKKYGYDLPMKSMEQASTCEKVSFDKLKLGDLIFYGSTEDNMVNHVGIYIGESKVIHAKNLKVGVTIEDINYRTPLSAGRVISD